MGNQDYERGYFEGHEKGREKRLSEEEYNRGYVVGYNDGTNLMLEAIVQQSMLKVEPIYVCTNCNRVMKLKMDNEDTKKGEN